MPAQYSVCENMKYIAVRDMRWHQDDLYGFRPDSLGIVQCFTLPSINELNHDYYANFFRELAHNLCNWLNGVQPSSNRVIDRPGMTERCLPCPECGSVYRLIRNVKGTVKIICYDCEHEEVLRDGN